MIDIILRKMEEKDIPNIYKYIHLNYVKKYFPDKEKEQWEAHKRWYSFVINSPTYLFYTVESLSREFLGTVKFEIVTKTKANISIYLVEKIRGKGYSEATIFHSIEELKFEKPQIKKICAYILEENEISKKTFIKNGFIYKGTKEYIGAEHLLYEKRISQEVRNDKKR
ncbi:GNAT family protein [uncultured Fusobacterium sp.]|uniref:GNAT family N-acetyltransferase n=1 Tax=uncultured Fusobacterium sp. TaxID=159267 RepID=UPI0025F81098|nr:GNAT family protein [uncultured Fusobacterium sp.]